MEDHLMKILIIGDGEVGKSTFVHRYVKGKFNDQYRMTLGVDFALKVLQWSEKEQVRLQLWDIAGQERFISMARVYYKGALGCVVMFDVTNKSSFHHCHNWKQDLDNKALLPNGDSIPCILLANKCDLPERAVSADSIDEFSKANGFVTWMETSVKENKNVGESMRRLVQEIMLVQSCMDPLYTGRQVTVNPQLDSELDNSRGKGCCTTKPQPETNDKPART
ncbi:ras-related protein Rab-7L1-like [Scomber scombrus]|uniref:Ras-related protein Rab n=1 Tax=Scomber scombrus TaxID=13677 RepID=A0AAV1PZ09_SCOSC|nr:ras-related protein Rab-7L1-like [Scomber scombrus]